MVEKEIKIELTEIAKLKEMELTAYHEAGHIAANCFTGTDPYEIAAISIIKDDNYNGYINMRIPYARSRLDSYPPPLQRSHGRMLLLETLAGLGTEIIYKYYDPRCNEVWDDVFTYWDLNGFVDSETSDIFEAESIANIMATPSIPAEKILELANEWTLKMLDIPAVWNCVKAIANKLIEKGKITDEKEIYELYKFSRTPDFPVIDKIPKWSKRLLLQPKEIKKLFPPISKEEQIAMLSNMKPFKKTPKTS